MNLKQKIFYAVGGLLIGNALLLVLFWGLQSAPYQKQREISVKEAFQKMDGNFIISATFENSSVVFEDTNGEKFVSTSCADTNCEVFFEAIKKYNLDNSKYPIRIEMKAANNGWSRLVLIKFLPFVLLFTAICFFIAAFFIAGKNNKLD